MLPGVTISWYYYIVFYTSVKQIIKPQRQMVVNNTYKYIYFMKQNCFKTMQKYEFTNS